MQKAKWKRRLPVLFGFIVSVATLWAVLDSADLSVFRGVADRIRPEFAGLFAFSVFLAHITSGLRWHMLTGSGISALSSIGIVAVGVGGNQALPARGGELLRLYLTDQLATRPEAGRLAGRMFVEKVLESGMVLGAGLVALFQTGEKLAPQWAERSGLLLGMYIGTTLLLYLGIRKRNESFVTGARWLFERFGAGPFFDEKLRPNLEGLGAGMAISQALRPLLLTLFLWLGPYVLMYFSVGQLLQIELSYLELLLLVCASAVGLALPSAPSGVGVIHAALVSAFVVMGRSPSEGLLFGTAAHMLAVFVNGVPAIPLYFLLLAKIRKSRPRGDGSRA